MKLRWMPAVAALICSMSVALGAYASHVASAQDQHRLALASAFAFAHALALLVLSARESRMAMAARLCLLAGIVLFSGSLAAAAIFGSSTGAAPVGGSLLILGWLVMAVDYLRNPGTHA